MTPALEKPTDAPGEGGQATRPSASNGGPAPAPAPPALDAIIYLPGLGAQWYNRSAAAVARRIARALDVTSLTGSARFAVDAPRGGAVPTIVRRDAERELRVIDVYRVDYRESLIARWEALNLFARAFFLALAILANLPRLAEALLRVGGKGKGKRRGETAQLLYALGILALLSIYMGVLAYAVYQAVVAALPEGLREGAPAAGGAAGRRLTLPQLGVVVLTGLGALRPQVREALTSAAVNYLAQVHYLRLGDRQDAVVGRLTAVLEEVAERGRYRQIHLLGYSFGSVVAMDALFPSGRDPTPRFGAVDALVTIGCPFDLVRSLWPDYFTDRRALPSVPHRWLNVHIPTDVLSSDFADVGGGPAAVELGADSAEVAADSAPPRPGRIIVYTRGVPGKLGFLEWVGLLGFRLHSAYWGAGGEEDINSLTLVVPELYPDDDEVRR